MNLSLHTVCTQCGHPYPRLPQDVAPVGRCPKCAAVPAATPTDYPSGLDARLPLACGADGIVKAATTLARNCNRTTVDVDCLVQAVLRSPVVVQSPYRNQVGEGIPPKPWKGVAPPVLTFCNSWFDKILPRAEELATQAVGTRTESVPTMYDIDLTRAVIEYALSSGWFRRQRSGWSFDPAELLTCCQPYTIGQTSEPTPVTQPPKPIRDTAYRLQLDRSPHGPWSSACLYLFDEAARIATTRALPSVDEECLLAAVFTAPGWQFAVHNCQNAGLTRAAVEAVLDTDSTPKVGPSRPLQLSTYVRDSVLPRAKAVAQMRGKSEVYDSYLFAAAIEVLNDDQVLRQYGDVDCARLLELVYRSAGIAGPITSEFDVPPPAPAFETVDVHRRDLAWVIDALTRNAQPFTLSGTADGKYTVTVSAEGAADVRRHVYPRAWSVLFQGTARGVSVTRLVHVRAKDKDEATTYARTRLFPDERHCEVTVVAEVP